MTRLRRKLFGALRVSALIPNPGSVDLTPDLPGIIIDDRISRAIPPESSKFNGNNDEPQTRPPLFTNPGEIHVSHFLYYRQEILATWKI